MNNLSLTKAERLAKTKGIKGWAAMLCLVALMCVDQFVLQIPFFNLVFPILIICAASMSLAKNLVLVALYSLIFELSCLAWNPADIFRAQWWLLEVFVGYLMPPVAYKAINRKHKNTSIFAYAGMAALGQFAYYWVSVAATVLLFGMNPTAYALSDLPYQLIGCVATFACTLPIAAIYKFMTGEMRFKKKSALQA